MNRHFVLLSFLIVLVLSVVASCGGGGGGTTQTPPFSQADLTGAWYISILQTGPTVSTGGDPGWIRGTADIASSGSISAPALYTSLTPSTPGPGLAGISWTIDPWTGILSEKSGTYSTDFHGKLASNKSIIVGTATGSPNVMQLRILQKKVAGTTYTTADIQNAAFAMHQIDSGVSDLWARATGSTDGGANVFLGVRTTATGTTTGGPIGTLSLDPATGLVSLDSNTYLQGMLSPDKSYIVSTETALSPSDLYRLTVLQLAKPGQTFTTADVAGLWHFHAVIGGMPAWVYQSVSIDSLGDVAITSELTSRGTATNLPAGTTAQLDSGGNFTSSDDPTLHATLSANKDLLVSTQTITDGGFFPTLGVSVK